MFTQRGNFLLQSLLALSLVFAFVPFLTRRIAGRDADARMYSATRQIEVAATAARIFIRENARNLAPGQTVVAGDSFADLLEPYGLPMGFVARNALGQDIALVINRDTDSVSAYLEMTGGNLSRVQIAELARRVGFYASPADDSLVVGIALSDIYSDVVRRNEPDVENSAFLTDLGMGGNNFNNAGVIMARRGEFATGEFDTMAVTGLENGRKVRSNIDMMSSEKTIFQSKGGAAALTLTRGTMAVGNISVNTIAKFGDMGNFTSDTASVYDFSMTAGRTSFYGPLNWDVRGNVVSNKISFSVERLDVQSFINASRGQDVYISEELEYSTKSGIETGVIAASNITMRDQTSDALNRGQTGAVIVDIRPAGTSVLPDAQIDTIDNGAFAILSAPGEDDASTTTCKAIIESLDGVYNQRSLTQYIICQYVYWQRLEQRIDIKQCLMAGGSDCA